MHEKRKSYQIHIRDFSKYFFLQKNGIFLNLMKAQQYSIGTLQQKLVCITCSFILHSIIENPGGRQKPYIFILFNAHGCADTKTTQLLQRRQLQARKIRKLHQHLIFSFASFTLDLDFTTSIKYSDYQETIEGEKCQDCYQKFRTGWKLKLHINGNNCQSDFNDSSNNSSNDFLNYL